MSTRRGDGRSTASAALCSRLTAPAESASVATSIAAQDPLGVVGDAEPRQGALAVAALTAPPPSRQPRAIPWLFAELLRPCRGFELCNQESQILGRQGRQLEVRDSAPRSLLQGVEARNQLRAVKRPELGGDACGSTLGGLGGAELSPQTGKLRIQGPPDLLSPHVLAYPEVLLERVRRGLLNHLFQGVRWFGVAAARPAAVGHG
jgi:hypothetical protein